MLLRQEWLTEIRWQLAVLDEAQAIKNPAARQTKAVKRLQADARIVLTGTPVENRLSDLWSLFDFLCPGLLGTQAKFKEFAKKLGDRQENRYAPLRSLVQPYILRRLKTDRRIIDDLPEKVEVRAFCGLSKRQAAMYAKLVHELAEHVEERRGDAATRAGAGLPDAVQATLQPPQPVVGRRPLRCRGERQVRPAGRDLRRDRLASAAGPGLHAVPRNDRAAGGLPGAGSSDARGWCSTAARPSNAARPSSISSNATTGPPFFVLSLKAGGTGLNLTAASHVIHFDRWWNPAVENQATDRAFRIGQQRNVLVHKFVCRGTIEERIDALIDEKRQLAADLLEGGAEKMLTEMSDAELIRFVSLDVDRATV